MAVNRTRRTVTDLAKNYFNCPDYARLSRSTRRNYASSWRTLAALYVSGKLFAEYLPHKITPAVVENIKDSIIVTRGVGAAKLTFALLNNIWDKAYRMELVKYNPWTTPKIRGAKKRDTMWTQQQIIRFAYMARHQYKWDDIALIFLLCYETSQRPIDIINLTKQQVGERDNNLYIFLKQQKTGTYVSLLVPDYLKDAIKNLLNVESPYDNIFLMRNGKPRTYATFAHCCDTIMKSDSLFEGLQIRDLRRTAITEAHNAKATEWEAMSLGGHKNPQSTIPYRVHSNEAAHEAQRKRWEARDSVNYWSDPSKPSSR